MPYLKAGGKTWQTRVKTRDGRRVICSTETTSLKTAKSVEAWANGVRDRLDPHGILEAIADRRIGLAEAYVLGEEGVRARFVRELEEALDVDLSPLLDEWIGIKRKATRGSVSADDYERQILTLFPEKPLRKSLLTVTAIARRLDALKVSDPTRNRYRAALSGWCKWLVRRGTLNTNPAREAGGYAERDGRDTWYEQPVAEKIIQAIPDVVYRGREAMFAGTGMDWSDADRLKVADINLRTLTVRCYGSKSKWRNRSIRITEGWTVPYIKAALANKLPDAKAFEGGERVALKWHHRAVAAVDAPKSTLHDWRHTYAVNALRNGLSATVVAHQLGHRDANLIWTRYGRFVPNATDYQKAIEAGSATDPATYQQSAQGV
ncbi:MAG: tyrosine-type recombinase/integrase [Gemmatimonas sp.]